MDFRNQKVSDIIYSIAELSGKSVFVDETVTGTVTFRFEDKDFESALYRFADFCQLYITKKDNIFYVSKVQLNVTSDKKIDLNTENVLIEALLNVLSRLTNTTILYDTFPHANVTIRVKGASLEDVLNLVIVKLPGFGLERVASGYYVTKSAGIAIRRNVDVFTVSNVDELFSISIQNARFVNVIETLFLKAKKEFSLFSNTSLQLENIFYTDKTFEELLSLLLVQGNCDYTIKDDIYYIFEVQKKDITKSFKETKIIRLKHINAETFMSVLPSELGGSGFIKIDRASNSVVLNGSLIEINPIVEFIAKIDVPMTDRFFARFDLKNIDVKEVAPLIPKSLLLSDIIQTPSGKSFITQVTKESKSALENFILVFDKKDFLQTVKLKYIKSEELLKLLPPSVQKENLIETNNKSILFFRGNETQYKDFCTELEKIDVPKEQIKYQILVIQRQKTDGVNWGTSFEANSTVEESGYTWHGLLSNIFNINFDIIAQFGVQFAGKLNAELSEGKSKVLADTTLNGISEETINFSNTNTYRYRDIVLGKDGDVYSSTTREIASGLMLDIKGWVSGEGMVTVKIDAQVSKQGNVNSSSKTETATPPPTSEKKVSTTVRTKTGEPVIIGGLIQKEIDTSEKRVPILGVIPLLGNFFKTKTTSTAETEFIIYLVPLVEKNNAEYLTETENLKRLQKKYAKDVQ
ncbi:MAG: hypothetical protein GX220_08655 [Treponema sp.]|nr:hypothetical protein [Treponema sp.]